MNTNDWKPKKEQRDELIELVLTEIMHNEDRVAENGMKSFNMQPIYDFIEKILATQEKQLREELKEALNLSYSLDENTKVGIYSHEELCKRYGLEKGLNRLREIEKAMDKAHKDYPVPKNFD